MIYPNCYPACDTNNEQHRKDKEAWLAELEQELVDYYKHKKEKTPGVYYRRGAVTSTKETIRSIKRWLKLPR